MSGFEALDRAMAAALAETFAEPALLRPRRSLQYAGRSADPDRAEAIINGIFSAGPALEDVSGQARGRQVTGTTRLSSVTAGFWITKAQRDALSWLPMTGDALALTARPDAPIYAITRIATSDMGDLTLILVQEDQAS